MRLLSADAMYVQYMYKYRQFAMIEKTVLIDTFYRVAIVITSVCIKTVAQTFRVGVKTICPACWDSFLKLDFLLQTKPDRESTLASSLSRVDLSRSDASKYLFSELLTMFSLSLLTSVTYPYISWTQPVSTTRFYCRIHELCTLLITIN